MRPLFALLCLGPAAVADDAKPADVPRYRLTPGRRIEYKSESAFKFGEGATAGIHRDGSEWTGWVLRANPDGSARLLIREVDHFASVRNGKEQKNEPTTRIVYADVFPDGRVLPNPTIRYRGDPAESLPRLPKDAAEAKVGWRSVAGDKTTTATPLGDGRFSTVRADAMDKVYLSTNKTTYSFDPARGLIGRGETESSQGHGFKGTGTGTTELISEKTLTAAELTALNADADRYFAAMAAYAEAFKAAEKLPPEQAKAALAKAGDALKATADAVKQPDMRAAAALRVKDHEQMAKYALEEAERRAKVVGKPAFAFDLADLDGKKATLADFRGRVVVLDFWYRGCGWCVKAMPQMNQLTADLAGEPVAVLGMNTDPDKADAEFVVKEMGLKYRTLRFEHAMAEKYGVQGFPTLVLIDKKGVVRDLHVGYSPTLREDVVKVVRELLAEK